MADRHALPVRARKVVVSEAGGECCLGDRRCCLITEEYQRRNSIHPGSCFDTFLSVTCFGGAYADGNKKYKKREIKTLIARIGPPAR